MGQLISASIDLNKIDKSKIVAGKNGAKYYNLLISINDTKNEHGQDVSISENQSKEEREGGAKKKYLGNGKTIWQSSKPEVSTPGVSEHSTNDELPF